MINHPTTLKKNLYPFFSKDKNYKVPLLMGVLNLTPDSFHDGGKYTDASKAIDHALFMQDLGADIIDIGAESSRPGSDPITEEEEWSRLDPILKKIRKKISIKISLDTYKYSTMKRALNCGVDIINDIYAMRTDERIPTLIAEHSAGVCLMHMKGDPKSMQVNTEYNDLLDDVITTLEGSVQLGIEAGLDSNSIVVDPGVGFGKSIEDNYRLINALKVLKKKLGMPVLYGISNKSFIKKSVDSESGSVTAAMNALHAYLMFEGADILRVHDMMDAASIRMIYQKMLRVNCASGD